MVAVTTLLLSATNKDDATIGVALSISLFKSDSRNFATATTELKTALLALDSTRPQTTVSAIEALKKARVAYKRIESVMEYFLINSARIYNRAPKNEIEEPYLEYQAPMGLQYLEALLFEKDPFAKKQDMLQQAQILESSALDLPSLLYEFKASDNQILESQRIELIRIIALGIVGFDAPLLKTGIAESYTALENIQKALVPYLSKPNKHTDSLTFHLAGSLAFLKQNSDFDTFDRLAFLTCHALPLQKYLGKMISSMNLNLDTPGVLNYQAEHLFSSNAFDNNVLNPGSGTAEISLGEKLFFETAMSGNGKISCSSCHSPALFFQDGIEKSLGFDGHSTVKRNAPTLLYGSFQHSQFWDGRARTLEEQIAMVIADSSEMQGKSDAIVSQLKTKKGYQKLFEKAYLQKGTSAINEKNIHRALASYVRTLHPFNSDFDRYIRGNKQAMTVSQTAGFNLFMGKGQCATCHFAPVFNGLIPPVYKFTEFEVLGTTQTENLSKPVNDPDQGRINFRPIIFYQGAFKTPTVRNTAETAPYMHNGAFTSMDSLMEFYNKGGGAGLGLDLPYQTLSPNPLNLTELEKKQIIHFLQALTDRPVAIRHRK